MSDTCTEANLVRATADDADRIAPLFDAYRLFYGLPSDPGGARAFLRDRIAREESVVYLALTRDGSHGEETPAGFVQLYPTFSSVSLCRSWTLNDLYVEEDHRARGVGRGLMERAVKHCRDTGAGQLWLQTDLTNTAAQHLYEAVGMTRHEILEYTLTI